MIEDYDVVVITEVFANLQEIIEINEICRENNKGFILSQNLGAYGYVFVDFGDEFTIKDATGREHKSFNVVGITKAKQGEVTVHKSKVHSFSDGDYVKFREIKGMKELNDRKDPIKIKVIDSYTFLLELDTTKFGNYEIDGIVESVNVPVIKHFQSLSDSLLHPHKTGDGFFINTDLSQFGRPDQLHIALQAIHKFQAENEALPMNRREEVHEVVDYAHQINDENKKKGGFYVDKVNDYVIKQAAKFSRAEICPLTSYFGGIV